jgi:hypothetical protein
MLAYLSLKAIYYLKDLAVDIIIDNNKLCPCKTDYETCMLAKAYKMVSRQTEG